MAENRTVERKMTANFGCFELSLDGFKYARDMDSQRHFDAKAGLEVEVEALPSHAPGYVQVRTKAMRGRGLWETWKRIGGK